MATLFVSPSTLYHSRRCTFCPCGGAPSSPLCNHILAPFAGSPSLYKNHFLFTFRRALLLLVRSFVRFNNTRSQNLWEEHPNDDTLITRSVNVNVVYEMWWAAGGDKGWRRWFSPTAQHIRYSVRHSVSRPDWDGGSGDAAYQQQEHTLSPTHRHTRNGNGATGG